MHVLFTIVRSFTENVRSICQMALQSALSRLRTATVATHSASSSKKSANAKGAPTPPPVFQLEDTDKDLFSLSDDEFLNDQSILFSPPSVTGDRASNAEGTAKLHSRQPTTEKKDQFSRDDITRCHDQDKPSDRRQFQNSRLSTGSDSTPLCRNYKSLPTPPSHTPPSNSSAKSTPRLSPATSSLERLRAFKFVKTPTMKGETRRAEEEEDGTLPAAKRRSVCDDVANTGRSVDEEEREAASREISSREHQQLPSNAGESVDGAGNLPPQDYGLESEMGIFLNDVERDAGEDGRKTTLTIECNITSSPSLFKVPPLRPPKVVSTLSSSHHVEPHRTSSVSDRRTLPDTGTPTRNYRLTSSPSTPAALTRSQSQRIPQQTHLATANTDSPSCDGTPCGSFASSAVLSTPKNRFTSRTSLASVMSTPVFQTPSSARRPAKRKFPGPAGLLPVLAPGQSLNGVSIPPPSAPPTPSSTPRMQMFSHTALPPGLRPCSPRAISESCDPQDFSQGPWASMMEDLDMSDPYASALLQYNIAKAVMQASHQQLRNGKVVHLRVLLKSIVPAGRSASAVLRDPTGEILCTLHRRVMEEHQSELQPGAALVLRQVSVFSPTPRKHYLNITLDNIVRIYPPSGSATRTPLLLLELEERLSDRHSSKEGFPQGSSSFPYTAVGDFGSSRSSESSRSIPIQIPAQVSHHSPSTSQRGDENADIFDQDWGSFEESCNIQQQHGPIRNSVLNGAPPTSEEARESLFTNQLCDDEFDSLFSDIADNSFSF